MPINSCHYNPWLNNIPKGQLIRLRRNCTRKTDFLDQADVIRRRFPNKSYYDNKLIQNRKWPLWKGMCLLKIKDR